MIKLASLLDANAAKIGRLETLAMGAPSWIAEHGVRALAQWLRYYAGWTDKLAGEVFPESGDGMYRMVTYEPLGVCAGIAAWNATFLFIAWKIAPAIAAGNTFVFKASEKSPLGVLEFAKLVKEAGFPPGVINLINGTGEAGTALAAHMKVAKISFTGSTATGRRVQIAAAQSNLKRCTLELGGKSAALVFDDADMNDALDALSKGFLINTTQVCAATTRLLVQESAAETFISQLKGRFEALTGAAGDPKAPETFMGPVADKDQFDRIRYFVNQAKADGLHILVGEEKSNGKGYFIQPTIIVDPPTSSNVYREEIFGPVLCIRTFTNEEEAVSMANDSDYGLGASVFTSNIDRALRVSGEIVAGSVGINCPIMPDVRIPFGGFKGSGYGRESGRAGLMAYVDSKTVSIKLKCGS
jgi:aldehyde dehydrogenase (NAD+)